MVNRRNRFTHLHRPLPQAALLAAAFLCVAAAPAAAAHRARLSADLADHLAVGSQDIDVIVHGDKAEVDALAARYNLKIKRYLKSGAVLHVNAGQLAALRDDDTVDHLSGDIQLKSLVDATTAESVGADQVWAGVGDLPPLSGEGVTVAVIDSGIDTRHEALRKRVLFTHDYTGGNGLDLFGHGTHVAAIIAGQAGRTAETREYRGIASGAYLVNLRVLKDDGSGVASDVIEAIDWVVEHGREYNVRIINLSLGAPVLQPYRDDPLCEAVERAVRAGVVVVTAAGNFGRAADGRTVLGSVTTPGNSPHAITVGAIDTHGTAKRSDDTLATYSSRGPTKYDLILKPDMAAPGSHIVSAESTESYLSKTHPERHVAGSGVNAYMELSGTSMSAGVVSGAVALLLEERSNLKPGDAKAVLQLTSSFMPSAGFLGAGAGNLNVLAAAEYAAHPETNLTTRLAGELQTLSGLLIVSRGYRLAGRPVYANSIVRGTSDSIVWGTSDSIVWGMSGDSIVWGTSDSIVWGTSADVIVWGTSTDSIVWGTSADAIVWDTSTDSIVWGT